MKSAAKYAILTSLLWLVTLSAGLAAQEIHEAAQKGDLVGVKAILAKNPESLRLKNQRGWTPLHSACFGGDLDIVKYLISQGADIDALTDSMDTTLHWAFHSLADPPKRKEIVELLISLNPKLVFPQNDLGTTPLMWAGNDLEETISLLLKKGADVNARDKNGYTALHQWTRWWQDDKSDVLLQNGAEIDIRDNHGRTPLHLAAITGRADKVRHLKDHGADLNTADDSGLTPLDYARKFAHPDVADFLEKSGGKSRQDKESVKYNHLPRARLDDGEAAIWYLDSNGWAVKTRNHLLIFDFLNWGIMPSNPCLSNGRINPKEIEGLNVTVFVSNPSGFSEEIFEWRKSIKNISFVFGYSPENSTGVYVVKPHEKIRINGLEIIPIQSVDDGAGFLVRTDGLSIFHGGSHCLSKKEWQNAFLQELEFLARNAGQMEIAFLTISTTRAVKESALEGFLCFGEKLRPRMMCPSGGSGTHKFLYPLAAEKIKSAGLGIVVKCADNRGDRFFYQHEGLDDRDFFRVDAKIIENLKPMAGTPGDDRRLYIIGGFKETEIFSEVFSVSVSDLISGRSADWGKHKALPETLQGHAAAAVNNHIFVVGGLEGFAENRGAIYSNDVFSAEIRESHLIEWKREKSLPHGLGYHAAVTYKDLIITSGGQTPADISTVYEARVNENGEIKAWETAGHLPRPMRGHASVIVKDRLFILGGHDDKEFFADVFSAPVDGAGKIGEWERTTSLPLPLVHFGAVEHNGRVYIFGGQDAKDALHPEVFSAEASGSKLGDWRRETPFPVPQSRMTVNTTDKRIIVTGGGFGWEPPVYSAVLVSEIDEKGRLGKWRKIGDLPGQLAFHAAVICPENRPRISLRDKRENHRKNEAREFFAVETGVVY